MEPFDFEKSLLFLQGFGPMGGERSIRQGTVTKALMLDGQTLVFRARGDGPGVSYELFSEKQLAGSIAELAAERVSFFLSREDDLRPFY